jgi:PAS domain S-box-containing protein
VTPNDSAEARVERVGRVAILAPTGRDARVAEAVLTRAGLMPRVFADARTLCDALRADAASAEEPRGGSLGVALVAEEALRDGARAELLAALGAQPSWSDVPVVVLTGEGELARAIPRGLEQLAARSNVTLLERPVRVTTLVTTLRAALHARRRQLDLRDYLEERRRAEQALRESESRLRDAVSSAPYPLMLHAEDGEILQLSRAWTATTGYAADELRTTRDWRARAHAVDTTDTMDAMLAFADDAPGTTRAAGEWAVRTARGEARTWDVHTVALAPLPDGRRLRLTAAMDVTAYRELVKREREAREQAESANRAKTEFLAMMSHELRTPLNAIGGYAQLLSLGVRGPVTEEQRLDLDRIDRSQRHLLSLINDILNFAKIEAGHVELASRPVAVREVLRGVEPLVAPQLRAKSLRYEDGTGTCELVVYVDPEKMQQILLNLLSNAIKFTEPGGVISIGCDAGTDARVGAPVAHVTVTDTGSGIPADKLGAVFEPFVQVQRHFTSVHEGTGLGLAISRDLARRMGGELSARSTLGVGTTFTLTVPLAQAP